MLQRLPQVVSRPFPPPPLSRWLLSQSAGAEAVPSQPTFLRSVSHDFLFLLSCKSTEESFLLLPKATSFSAFPTGAISVYLTTICLDQSSWESTRELRNASRKCLTANTCLTKYSLLILHFSYQWLAHPSQVSVNIQGRQLRGKNQSIKPAFLKLLRILSSKRRFSFALRYTLLSIIATGI